MTLSFWTRTRHARAPRWHGRSFPLLNVLAVTVSFVHVAITGATLAGLPRQTLTVTDSHGQTATYGGIALRDILSEHGIPSGDAMKGEAMTRYVVIDAADGYRVTFSLAELDASFTDRTVLVADTREGAALPAKDGPYRLIVPGDKREARWVRQVTGVDIENAATHEN